MKKKMISCIIIHLEDYLFHKQNQNNINFKQTVHENLCEYCYTSSFKKLEIINYFTNISSLLFNFEFIIIKDEIICALFFKK
jgi:hypothetical protein